MDAVFLFFLQEENSHGSGLTSTKNQSQNSAPKKLVQNDVATHDATSSSDHPTHPSSHTIPSSPGLLHTSSLPALNQVTSLRTSPNIYSSSLPNIRISIPPPSPASSSSPSCATTIDHTMSPSDHQSPPPHRESFSYLFTSSSNALTTQRVSPSLTLPPSQSQEPLLPDTDNVNEVRNYIIGQTYTVHNNSGNVMTNNNAI